MQVESYIYMYMYSVLLTLVILCDVFFFHLYGRITVDNGAKQLEVGVVGSVVTAKLELMSQPNLAPVNVLHLGAIYYGSLIKKAITLYNNSPSTTNFITVMDTQRIGHEQVSYFTFMYIHVFYIVHVTYMYGSN